MSIFKKYFTILYLFTILFSLLQANEKTHFTIAIDPEYIPFTQKDIDGNPTGLLVDFWSLWAQKNAYTVEYKFYLWEETLLATQKGEVDFHSGTTKDREWMQASDTIYQLHTAVFTLSDSKLSEAIDFKGKRLGTINTYYAELVEEVVGKDIIVTVYDDYAPMVEALKSGDIDFLVDDVEAVMYYFIKIGQMHRFKQIQDKKLHFYNKIFAISNIENAAVLKQVNNGLKKLNLSERVKIEKVWLPTVENAYYNKQLHGQETYGLEFSFSTAVSGLFGLLLISIGYAYIMRRKHKDAKEANQSMKEIALTDDLTGLYNKRAFNENFESKHYDRTSLGLLFLDIDYFKKYNDYYGHMKGDLALKKVSQVLQDFTSDSCFPYRVGGEEFGLVLYDYKKENAVKLAETICKTIVDLNIDHQASPFEYMTVSIGIAVGDSDIDRHMLYQCADKALYLAKDLGRNKVSLNQCEESDFTETFYSSSLRVNHA